MAVNGFTVHSGSEVSNTHLQCPLLPAGCPRVGTGVSTWAFVPDSRLLLYDDILPAGKSDYCLMLLFLAKVLTDLELL